MKNLFKKAHEMAREIKKQYPEVDYKVQFGLCLSYLHNNKEAKVEEIIIKDWFLEKNFTQNELYAISVADTRVVRETEKAMLIDFVSDYGTIRSWIPKSCIMTAEEVKEAAEKREKAFESGRKKYEALLNWAKANNVKGVRNRMKKATILNRIAQAGLAAPQELI